MGSAVRYALSVLVLVCLWLVVPVSAIAGPTASFTASRTTGAAPLAVLFDATGTTHSDGDVDPFHDLHYRLGFGDPTDTSPFWGVGNCIAECDGGEAGRVRIGFYGPDYTGILVSDETEVRISGTGVYDGTYTVEKVQTTSSTWSFQFASPGGVYHGMANGRWRLESGYWPYGGAAEADAKQPKNTECCGPVAAHVFDPTPGTGEQIYTVTLTVTDMAGNTDTDTVNITITDQDDQWAPATDTYCFSNAPADYTDCPAGVPGGNKIETDNFNTAMTACGSADRRCLFHEGDTFNTASTVSLSGAAASMVGMYGSGAKPIINQTHTDEAIDFGLSTDDWRFVDLDFDGPGSGGSSYMFSANRQVDNILIYRTEATQNTYQNAIVMGYSALNAAGDDLHENLFFVENNWDDFGFGTGGGTLFVAARGLAALGNRIYDSVDAEHVTRFQHLEGAVIAHNDLGKSKSNRAVLNIRSADQDGKCESGDPHVGEDCTLPTGDPCASPAACEFCSAACGDPTKEVVISDNVLRASSRTPNSFTGADQPTERAQGEDFIFERNFLTLDSGTVDNGLNMVTTDRVTVRNNIADGTGWNYFRAFAIQDSSTVVNSYHNSCYTDFSGAKSDALCLRYRGDSEETSEAFNNLGYFPNRPDGIFIEGWAGLLDHDDNVLATSDPFVDATPTSPEDFMLSGTDETVGQGATTKTLGDFTGDARAPGVGQDLGAYEYEGGGLQGGSMSGGSL